MRIERRHLRRLLPLLAALALLPRSGDAVNNVQCCNVATSFATSLFGGGNGDEDFFSVPAGSPNLMILLGNTSEMLDFPNPLPFPSTWDSTGGTCSGTTLDNSSTAALATPAPAPYDNGYTSTTVLTTDDPPWATRGTRACTPLASGAASATTNCLFSPNGFYFYPAQLSGTRWVGKLGSSGLGDATVSWATGSAKEYSSSAQICASGRVKTPSACQTCLDTKGYYLFSDQSVNGSNRPNGAFFRGSFLNVFPPKFVVARKLVKQLARVDSGVPSLVDNVRMGLSVLSTKTASNSNQKNSLATSDGGVLLVPLGPNCTVYPAHQTDMQAPRQAIIDAINNTSTVFFNQTNAAVITNPVAETLYQIGEYFSNYPASGNVYTSLFGTSWVTGSNSSWIQSSAGAVNASWVNSTDQRSFCWSCQQSSVLILSDGEPWNDNNLPQGGTSTSHTTIQNSSNLGDFRYWSNGKIDCPTCGTDAASGVSNLLHKVAGFLNSTDLRPELSDVQSVHTYTVSFGLDPTVHTAAMAILQKTADLGGGTYSNATTADQLEQALNDAATDVLARATSFSVSNTTPLQTSQNNQLFLARFRPSSSPAWEGHVYRFRVFNEFAEGCDATKSTAAQIQTTCTTASGTTVTLNPNLNGDEVSGKAVCSSIFILDGDCNTVLEDSNGAFKKASFDASHNLYIPDATRDANPYWDAGKELSTTTEPGYRSAGTGTDRRLIYTLIDSDGDGRYTSSDRMIEVSTALETSAPTDWAALKAALGVDTTNCKKLFERMGVNGITGWDLSSTLPQTTIDAALNRCAEQVVYFIRGWDVLDEDDDGCGAPGFPTNLTLKPDGTTFCPGGVDGEQRNRASDTRAADGQTFWKLGDIFHSSPTLVNPPAMEFVCDLALDNQCVSTLHSPAALAGAVQTPIAQYTVSSTQVDAYEKYRRDNVTRRRVLLVGANDGMLHAFDAGTANTSATADAAGNYPYGAGNGAELWAFIPPDLLPKLKLAPLGHQYFVDGNIMVRDIWADGSDGSSRDGKKQSGEFHTIAVLSERSGGTEYVALDVTNPASPRFRWMYPDPCSRDVSMVGQSWSGFAPRPPPIGPVKLAVTRSGPLDPAGRGFEERWIVMINGGYDPSLTRGRGVWMMDAWTGATVWRFTNDEFAQNVNAQGGMWPVPGAVALLDIGAGDQPKVDSDGFFDTATWGDIGGQIYVARFNSPDSTTWAAARAFEENRQIDDTQPIASRSEFYYMPGNTVDPATGYLHTYLGSGNRERMLASGPSCGPDNVFGCFQAGCNTDVTTVYDYGSCSYRVKAHANNGTIKQDVSDTTGTACADNTTLACNQINVDIKVETVCNGWKPDGGSFHASLSCAADGTCSTQNSVQKGGNAPGYRLNATSYRNRFYGVWTYGGSRTFNSVAGAVTFDQNRFTDATYAGTCSGPTGSTCTLVDVTQAQVSASGTVTCASGTSCQAGSYDAGWMYEYGHASACPLLTSCGATDWTDEKTGSGGTVLAGCVDWNTFRPNGSSTSAITPCNTNAGTAKNYTYLADYLSGVPTTTCGVTGTTAIARASSRSTNVPPLDPTHMVSLGANGQTTYSVAIIEPGAPPQSRQVGTGNDGNAMIYWLEVPRDLHACRHSDATQCQ